MKKRAILLIIALLLILTQVLSGCSVKGNTNVQADNDNKATDDPAAEGSDPDKLYPIPGNVTLRIWMPINKAAAQYVTSYAEVDSFKRAMEDTGVKLEFIHPAIGQETEAYNIMIASRDYPDISFSQQYKGGPVQAVKDGVFEDLTDLVPKYAPAYYALLQKNDEFRREATTTDGRIYSFYVYKDVPAQLEGEWFRTQFRKDWLEEFNMDVPKTFDQYEEYFKKVLETKPDVAPFVLKSDGIEKQLLQPFGLSTDFFLKDGKVTWFGVNPEYKDYLALLNKWFQAGYISRDFATVDPMNLFLAGKAACFLGISINTFQACKELGIPVTTGPYVRLYEGQKLHAAYCLFPKNSNTYDGNIYTTSKYKKEACLFINYGYTEDGYKTYHYGPEGLAWTMGEDGIPKYTDYVLNHPKYSITDVDYMIRLHQAIARLRDNDRYSIPANIKDPETLEYRLMWADDPDADSSAILPPFELTPEANTELAEIMNDITTYVKEMTLKFIVGAEPLDNFDKYIQTLKSMNIDRAIEIMQEAYDFHMSK